MDTDSTAEEMLAYIHSDQFAAEYWANRPPMTVEERDAELRLADAMIERGNALESWETVLLWTEKRRHVLEFYESRHAA